MSLSRTLQLSLTLSLLAVAAAGANEYVDDFSGDLSGWTASPAHLESYSIVDGQMYLDGYGHLTGPSGWGVMQFNQPLGSHFVAEWDARIMYDDYINFTLHADTPRAFQSNGGSALNGYLGWIDVNDPVLPKMDLRMAVDGGTVWLGPLRENIELPNDVVYNQ